MPAARKAVPLPASFGVLRDEAIVMFKTLERRRAQAHIHQLANGKADDDIYLEDEEEGVTRTYTEERKFIEDCKRNLRQGLPPIVIRAVRARLKMAEEEDEEA